MPLGCLRFFIAFSTKGCEPAPSREKTAFLLPVHTSLCQLLDRQWDGHT